MEKKNTLFICYIVSMDVRSEIKELVKKLTDYQRAYYVDSKPLVSDMEYDRLYDELVKLERENPDMVLPDSPTQRVGSDLTNDFPEFRHTIPVLSLDKAYSRDEVISFMEKTIARQKKDLSFVAEEKIDGISMVLYYEKGLLVRGVTRGNGEVGNDVTGNIRTIGSIPLRLTEEIDIAVRGEVFLSKESFIAVNSRLDDDKKAANPRNLAAGTVRRQKSSEASLVPLDIFCYEGFWSESEEEPESHLEILSCLKRLGFKINPHLACFSENKEESRRMLSSAGLEGLAYSFSEMQDYIDYKTKERKDLEYEIDGLVFKVNEIKVRNLLGYTEHHPRWAIAYKFESPQAVSRLTGISVQVGRTGRITPVAELEPVALGGSTIRRASLHNQEYIDSLELAIGDTVSIVKRGDVIPQVEDVIEKNESGNTTYKIDMHCPCCRSELVKDGAHLFCPNPECPEQAIGMLSFFASRTQMDIETLGPKTIKQFYEEGLLRKVEDIYSAPYASLIGKKGIGEKTVNAIVESVEQSKKQPFKVVLSSLGINEIGKKSAEILISGGFDSIDKLESASVEDLMKIDGIGEKTASIIVSSFKNQRLLETVEKLRDAGLHFSVDEDEKGSDDVEQSLEGTLWCVTGSFEHFNPRSKAMDEIEKRGGRTGSSVTGKTTHLLAGKGAGSKLQEAMRLGVRIVDEEEFISMLGSLEAEKDDQEKGQLELF